MKRVYIVLIVVFLLAASLSAQSNQIIDQILAESRLTGGSAAYLVMSVGDGAAEPASREAAWSELTAAYDLQVYGLQSIEDPVSMGLFSYLLQERLDLPRGVGSTLMAGPRYALRDLKFLQIVQGQVSSAGELSGERALRILGRALTELEGRV